MNFKKILIIVSFLFFLFFFGSIFPVFAQEKVDETLEASIVNVLEEKEIELMGEKQLYQKLELKVTSGSLKDRKIVVENGNLPVANLQKYKTGDRVILNYSKDFEGNNVFYITDYIRRSSLFWLFVIFIILTAVIAKWRGIFSLLGMGASFLVIFKFILPNILDGADPIQTAIFGSLLIIPLTFFLSHGFNKKTIVAIGGTIISLIITGILAGIFVEASKLTGFASEEASFLQVAKQGAINVKGLLLAGIIICVLGVLDDITISQAAIVYQLKKTDPKLKQRELYKKAMDVGRDHISSMVNTLILVYTGAALPLLLLFVNNPHPFLEVINYEIMADEIVRTLVGSIGLILAVPITTLIASFSVEEKLWQN
jgi:uncharacterized membrane protein